MHDYLRWRIRRKSGYLSLLQELKSLELVERAISNGIAEAKKIPVNTVSNFVHTEGNIDREVLIMLVNDGVLRVIKKYGLRGALNAIIRLLFSQGKL